MHRKAQNSPREEDKQEEYKKFSEENSKLHKYAEEILRMMDSHGTEEHKKFTQKLLEEYSKLNESKAGKYSQDWSAYNSAQQKEKVMLMRILDELLSYIPFEKKTGIGRPSVSIRDKIFYVISQAYNIKSSRRCISDLAIAHKLGYVEKTPHFNTVLKCLNDQSITIYLKHLVQVSGLPLQQVETDFAVDSSGFSTSEFGRWNDFKWGKHEGKERLWKKIHLTCGVRTNIITAVNITPSSYADSPQFSDLVKETSKIYNIKEVSADKAYSSRNNLETVSDLGGIAFIPFKSNVTGRMKTSIIWKKMYKFFTEYQDEFYHHYHKRSNVESSFHMLKRKFGSHLRSRHETGQTNEILAKCLCHNICVLIQEAFEIDIDLDFKKCANIEIAHK